MSLAHWDGSLAIGVDIVDRQHRELHELINSFSESIGRDEDRYSLALILDSLRNYVHNHFATEEKLLEKNGCPQREGHAGAHLASMGLVAAYEKEIETITRDKLVNLRDYLLGWLSNHIRDEDMRLREYFAP